MQFADAQPVKRRIITLLGAPKTGKTVCAATASAHYPDKVPAPKKTYLKDMVWLQFDTNGVESLRQFNVYPYLIDLAGLTELKALQPAVQQALQEVKKGIAEGGIRWVVVDSVTVYNVILVNACRKIHGNDKRATGALYNQVLGLHMDLVMQLQELEANIVAICHTTVKNNFFADGDSDKARKQAELEELRKRAVGLPDGGSIVADLTGKASNYYKASSDAIWPVVRVNEGASAKHYILPRGGFGFEAAALRAFTATP